MGRTLFVALVGIIFLFSTVPTADAGKPRPGGRGGGRGKKVWSGLVMGTNAGKPGPGPGAPELSRLNGTLRRTFGYKQYEVIAQSRRALQSGEPSWLAVSKHFSLQVDPRGVSPDGYRVNLKLYQDRQLLLETAATLSARSPLVIKGPQVGSGQLLLLLVLQ